MNALPIDEAMPRILESLKEASGLVIVAPPGAGKTTRFPPALLASGLMSPGHPGVIVLQPRRVAARATAARIAEEQGWTLGEQVGYQVRLERRMSQRTRLRIQTEGILTRQLLADPFLESIGAVILDEFHERNLHTDLSLALLREIRREVRPDLRLIVMSATLDAEPVAGFLGDCPIVRVEGRAYPVEIEYRPTTRPASPEALLPLIRERLNERDDLGHILVFLPGMGEIRRVMREAGPIAEQCGAVVFPLHGSLPAEEQARALRPDQRRKIILATNVAETSLTIDGVSTVIDSGLARVAHHDPQRGFDRLELARISQASATQRTGRAGRTGPGRCIRLWSEREQRGMAPFERPEIHRVDLSETVLALRSWGVQDLSAFAWFDPPAPERLTAAEELLIELGALERGQGRITPLGNQMLRLPVHPRLARLLLAAAEQGRLREGATLAALLSEQDIAADERAERSFGARPRPSSNRGLCDLIPRMDWLFEAESARFAPSLRSRGIDPAAARQVARIRDDLIRIASKLERSIPGRDADVEVEDEMLLKWLILAYPDRVVRRRGTEGTGVMVGGRGVRLARESIVREGELFLALDPREERRDGTLELQVRLASTVAQDWLEELVPHGLRRERTARYDETRERVVEVNSLWYLDLLLREDASRSVLGEDASAVLAAALRPRATSLFTEDAAAAAWLGRLRFVSQALPELDWPEFAEQTFAELLELMCLGKSTAEELRRADKVHILESRLGHSLRRELLQSAPESIPVPSGRQARLTYDTEGPPVLAVRLQELFGWSETPRLARGRVPLLLHVLGPNYRPVQITSDLASFWKNTYPQVRKDLRGRYPKHAWPEDPLTAQARPEKEHRRD